MPFILGDSNFVILQSKVKCQLFKHFSVLCLSEPNSMPHELLVGFLTEQQPVGFEGTKLILEPNFYSPYKPS